MSDTSLNNFLQYGTNAQRLAFTPSPAAGIKPLYGFYETDTDTTWVYTTGWHQISSGGGAGTLIQTAFTSTSAVATGTTTIPADDTKPQKTEGDQYLSLAITPTSSSHKLYIDCTLMCSPSIVVGVVVALFQDTASDALATVLSYVSTANGFVTIPLSHEMAAGTTSSTTFKIRAGLYSAGTLTVNGQSGGRLFGGVAMSTLRIFETL